jgi:hypothetical protein
MTKRRFILLSVLALVGSWLVASCDDAEDDPEDDQDGGGDDVVWTDTDSGLMWQFTPAHDYLNWRDAQDYCESLTLGGYNDWHLPTISEMRTFVRGCDNTQPGGACPVTDDCLDTDCWDSRCEGCEWDGGPANHCYWPSEVGGRCDWFWSSSPTTDVGNGAWGFLFNAGYVHFSDVGLIAFVRCVR